MNDIATPAPQVLMTMDGQDKYTAAYSYGLKRIKVEAPDNTRPDSQVPLYYLHDGLGSTKQLVRSNGAVRDHYNYDEFGDTVGAKLSEDGRNVNHNTFGYTGEMWDEEDDLLYLRSRYYASNIGRFMTRDTFPGYAVNPLSMHKYDYVENDPVNKVDPLGYWGRDVHLQDTHNWARQIGFSRGEADIISSAAQYVDENPETEPKFGDQSWHFDRSQVDNDSSNADTRLVHASEYLSLAISYLEQGKRREALWALGTALHPLQDVYAHMDAGINNDGRIYEPHDDILDWRKYDDTLWDYRNNEWVHVDSEQNNSRWIGTRDATYGYLQYFFSYEKSLNNKKKKN